jgi:hypothetical protein
MTMDKKELRGLRRMVEWTDQDCAAAAIAQHLGLIDFEKHPFQTSSKHVFWTANPIGDLLTAMLYEMVEVGILEFRDEPDLQFRWNPNFEGSWETPRSDTKG